MRTFYGAMGREGKSQETEQLASVGLASVHRVSVYQRHAVLRSNSRSTRCRSGRSVGNRGGLNSPSSIAERQANAGIDLR